jgi:NADH dehydrogenase
VQSLERRLGGRRDVEIVLLDRHNYFAFTLLLVEAGTGSLQPRHAVVSLRAFTKRSRFLMAEATRVDVPGRRLYYRSAASEAEQCLAYDHLVLALGSVTRHPPVPGLAEHAFGMKSLTDAVALRDRAILMLELAEASEDPALRRELLHFVVVGGNFTGVEVAGEYLHFLRAASKRYPRLSPGDCRVTLIEISGRMLGALGEGLSGYAARQLARAGVEMRTRCSVQSIEPEALVLDDGSRLASRSVIWCAGIAAPPPLWSGDLPCNPQGWLLCAPDLRVEGQACIWAIGDCAVNRDAEGRSLPATAQSAVQEGRQLAANLAAAVDGRALRPLRYRQYGSLAALGCRTGVAELYGIKLSGFWAWFLWRTVYLFKMPGASRRLRVAVDWSLDLLFPRDYVTLGLHAPGERRPAAGDATAARRCVARRPAA